MNTLVQFLGTSWIFLVENCVREEPTGLPWKNLKERWPREEKALVTFIDLSLFLLTEHDMKVVLTEL